MSPRGLSRVKKLGLALAERGLGWVQDFWITTLVLIACGLLGYTAYQQRELARRTNAAAVQAHATAVQAADTAARARELARANRLLLAEIQRSRVESCERTYEGVREIFRPFFPATSKETPAQRRNRIKFNHRVDLLKARCPSQTAPADTRP